MYSVTTLLTDLGSVTHGTRTTKIPNIYGHINRAARQVLQDVDPKETQKITQLAQVFNSVFDYPSPVDLKGDRLVDLRPQAGRDPGDIFQQGYSENFDAWKNWSLENKIITQWNTGVKTLRIEAPTLTAPVTITDTGSITGWTATAGAQNISLDQTNNVAGGGAIVFDLAAGSSTGSIQISTLSPVDLTGHVNIDTEFYWVYLPTGSAITSLNLKWGSDYTANYYNLTVTTTQQGTAFQNGWNLIALTWSSATKVGTPVITAYDSVQLTVAYNSTLQTGLKFCNLTSNTGYIFEMQYYSKYMFRNPSTNVFQETVADSSDNDKILNLDTDSYNLMFDKTAYYIAQALQGADASYDATFWDAEYTAALTRYRALNPSESKVKAATYYDMPRNSRNVYPGRFFGTP
jgi:hypothetical protein